MSRGYISIREAAEYIGTSTTTVRRRIADGDSRHTAPARAIGLLRVDLDDIDDRLM